MQFLAILLVGFSGVLHLAEGKTTRTVTLTIVERAAASSAVASAVATPSCAPYWLELVKHQGVAAFNPDPSYKVFRNVKDFGAMGNGIADDTAAINLAISSGGRCGPGCASSSTTQAIVYFPPGTYIISSSIIDYYSTQLIGNPNCPPVLKATPGITGLGIIDGNQYQLTGGLAWGSTDVFWRQIRNFVLDMTAVPPGKDVTGIHWPTAQSTSLQNIVFKMSDSPGTRHVGLSIESGSGGMMNDLVFYGGLRGASIGNQQFTMRNITFNNSVTAIYQLWDWGWTYKSIHINNCSIGIDITALKTGDQEVGSITLFDSTISNTAVGISTAHTLSQIGTGGSMFLENVQLNNVPIAIQGPGPTVILPGTAGSGTIPGWGQGHAYTPGGPVNFQGPVPPLIRPPSLLEGGIYYERSKPQYGTASIYKFRSTRDGGAKGDGTTDDTAALQATIDNAATSGDIVFFDAGTYKITDTLYIPKGSKIVGEAYPVIMSSGSKFADMDNPRAVVVVGKTGEKGVVEWVDMIVSTQGAQAGAILIQWNLTAPASAPSGMWDVHTRVGGFKGSELQAAQCPTTPNTAIGANSVIKSCIGAFMMMHIAPSASGLYLENVWHWTADHDLDDPALVRITVYSGRGLHVESKKGNIWLSLLRPPNSVGTSVEHSTLYQYQFHNTSCLFAGQLQTESPYYQPNPQSPLPFPPSPLHNDPDFAATCAGKPAACTMAWGLRIVDSTETLIYGAGLYSFFNNYNTTCSDPGAEDCQSGIFSLEGQRTSVAAYGLNTVGSKSMIDRDGVSLAAAADNINAFPDSIALFWS